MLKNISLMTILAVAGFGLVACGDNNTKVNTNINSNTAVVLNNSSVMNSAANMMNSNANMSNSNTGKGVSSADKDFMNDAATGGMEEVKLGELAATKAQSPEVKAFGQRMVTDHGKANAELKTLAANKDVTLPTDLKSEQKEDSDKLSKLSGAAFDKEYVKMMVEDHEKDVAEFQKQSTGAIDSDVKSFAAKTLPTLQSHLDQIKAIQAKMK